VKTETKIEERYLRVIGTGEIVRWKNFSEITQVYEVESLGGKVFMVQSNRVSQQVTAEEANQFRNAIQPR
jgi:hypothetical protein